MTMLQHLWDFHHTQPASRQAQSTALRHKVPHIPAAAVPTAIGKPRGPSLARYRPAQGAITSMPRAEQDGPQPPPIAQQLQHVQMMLWYLGQISQATTYQPNALRQGLVAALPSLRTIFAAQAAHCWLAASDGELNLLGEPLSPRRWHSAVQRVARAAQARGATTASLDERLGIHIIALPLARHDRSYGVLTVVLPANRPLTLEEERMLAIIATQIVQAIVTDATLAELHLLRAMHESFDDAVIVQDRDGQTIAFNQKAKELAINRKAITAAQLGGATAPDPQWKTTWPSGEEIAPEDLPSVRVGQGREAKVRCEMEITLEPEAGPERVIPLLVTAKPLRDQRNGLIGTLVAVQDLSSIKNAEHYKDAYFRRNVHDLRTPLTTIRFAFNHLKKAADDFHQGHLTGDQLYREILNRCDPPQKAIDRINHDIDKIVQAEVDMGMMERMSLLTFVNDYLHQLRDDFGPQRIQWDLDAADAGLVGYWNPKDIESMIGNLINNAMKYSPEDTLVYVQLFSRTVGERQLAYLVVQDQGYGIPVADLERIFEPDVRCVDYMPAAIPGNGRGLYYCRELAQKYAGTLSADSAGPQTGSTFTLRLPLAPAPGAV